MPEKRFSSTQKLSRLGAHGAVLTEFIEQVKTQFPACQKAVDVFLLERLLNRAYFANQQWINYDDKSMRLLQVPPDEETLGENVTRVTNNIIRSKVLEHVSQLVGPVPKFEVIPSQSQLSDVVQAKSLNELAEANWCFFAMRQFWQKAHVLKSIVGTSFQKVFWDENGGGIDPTTRKPRGEVAIVVRPPSSIFPDPTAERVVPERTESTDARYLYEKEVVDVEVIRGNPRWQTAKTSKSLAGNLIVYGGLPDDEELNLASQTVPTEAEAGELEVTERYPKQELEAAASAPKGKKSGFVNVISYYEHPTARYPAGRFAVLLPDNDYWPLEYREELPYATKEHPNGLFPFTMLVDVQVPGRLAGLSRVSEVRELQDAANRLMTRWITSLDKFQPHVRVDLDSGFSFDAMKETSAGIVYPYHSSAGGQPPEQISPPAARAETALLENALTILIRQVEDRMGIHAVRYHPRTEATLGEVQIMKNEDFAVMSSVDAVRAEEWAYGPLMKLVLRLQQRYYTDERFIDYLGGHNRAISRRVKGADIHVKDVRIVMGSSMPRNVTLMKLEFLRMLEHGMFATTNPKERDLFRREAARIMNLDLTIDLTHAQLDANNAQAENLLMLEGKECPVDWFDSHEIHYEEHLRFAKSPDYRNLEPTRKEAVGRLLRTHLELTKRLWAQETELASVTPGVLAAMAQEKAGVQETPAQAASRIPAVNRAMQAAAGTPPETEGEPKTGNLLGT